MIAEAEVAGARRAAACKVVGLSVRTVERWHARPQGDDRRHGPKRSPRNALSRAEQARVVSVMTCPEHAALSPKQLVPRLADKGIYLASESTMYRLRRRLDLRSGAKAPARAHVTRATAVHRATRPNQVWSWDITYLPTAVRGRFLYLYLVVDVWSRRIVGWQVHDRENPELAAAMVARICAESRFDPKGLVLHSDNGKPMRGSTMVSTLQWLGIVPSFSRPHVSNDNPYSEALFRTLKHGPTYPHLPFADGRAAAHWVDGFVDWYNTQHRHSAIRFVTPDERHFAREGARLGARHSLYQRARRRWPERWSRTTRDWSPVGAVVLNPAPDALPETHR